MFKILLSSVLCLIFNGLFIRSTQNLSGPDGDDRHYQNIAFHAPPAHRSPHHHPQHPRPASALLQRDDMMAGRGDSLHRQDLYRPLSQRDVRHMEPRLVHLPEETEQTHPPHHMEHQPPPTAPKPRQPGQPQYRPPHLDNHQQYRESPPPPPPPASTHPLLQASTTTTRQPMYNKTSAWEREEKERVSALW